MVAASTRADVRPVDADEFAALLPRLMQIYIDAMGYAPQVVPSRQATAMAHARLDGFAAFVASIEGTPVGFGYGYLTRDGQWWHGQVRRALGGDADRWLRDAFELCELHVDPAHHRLGIGRRLLHALLEASAGRTVVLSTPDGPSPARQLYDRSGFRLLAEGFRFATDRRPFTVMGRPASAPDAQRGGDA